MIIARFYQRRCDIARDGKNGREKTPLSSFLSLACRQAGSRGEDV
jgi:hypothetical protein